MAWNLTSDRPIYLQIMEHIQTDIIAGTYLPGEKLPSVRELASEAGVNPNTMQKALSELENSGLIHTERTSGRFITDDPEVILVQRHTRAREETVTYIGKMEQLGQERDQIAAFVANTVKELRE